MRPPRAFRTVSVIVLALALGACSSSGSGQAAPGSSSPASSSSSTTAKPAGPPPIGHVFVINLENEDFGATWGPTSPAKYLNDTLRPQGQLLTNYYGVGHESLDNYIAQISGQAPNPQTQGDCPTYTEFAAKGTGRYGQLLGQGCVFPKSVKTIGDQLVAAGKTWKAYQDDIGASPTAPKTCRHPAFGAVDTTVIATKTDMYATRHDPWVYFHSIIDSPACNTEVVGLDVLSQDLGSIATTPDLSYITPDVCDDGHDAPCKDGRPGGLVSADAFLRVWVPRILASPAFKADGMLVITLDEAESSGKDGDSTACCHTPRDPNAAHPGIEGPGGGRVGALVISARTKPGTTNPTPYNHYSLLCSMENVWGLDHLGFAGAPGLSCFGNDVYDRTSLVPPS